MQHMQIDYIQLTLTISLIIVAFGLGIVWQDENAILNNNTIKFCEGLNLEKESFVRGYYSSEGYYCIRTDMSWYEEKETIIHEECHALIHKNTKHFCEE